MTTYSNRSMLSPEELKERYEAAVERFNKREINEDSFRRLLASLGFNATEIELEVHNAKQWEDPAEGET